MSFVFLLIQMYFTADAIDVEPLEPITKKRAFNIIVSVFAYNQIKNVEIKETDIIILGGGDILNDYFLDEINTKFKDKSNKIIAVSVGLPYINVLIQTEKLSIIDYIFLRTEQDMETFGRYFRKDRLFYIPDISFYLKNFDIPKIKNVYSNNLKNIRRSGTKVIAFCLNRHIYSLSRCLNYEDIVLEFVKTIMYLLQRKHFIVLLPFNTNEKNSENDIITILPLILRRVTSISTYY